MHPLVMGYLIIISYIQKEVLSFILLIKLRTQFRSNKIQRECVYIRICVKYNLYNDAIKVLQFSESRAALKSECRETGRERIFQL